MNHCKRPKSPSGNNINLCLLVMVAVVVEMVVETKLVLVPMTVEMVVVVRIMGWRWWRWWWS